MPTGSRDVVAFQPDTVEWDTLVWAYSQRWTATLPGFPRGTLVRYEIEATLVDGSTVGADLDRWTGQPTPFAVLVDDDPDPGWLADSVIYNVFVDRFSPGDGRQWLSPDALDGFYGGTIRGVTEKIPYLADLGIDCVWLSPIFPSPSHHGYDATDYLTIEPRLGTEADLVELIDTAHRAGIRVVLDFVANHVSDRHPSFVSATTDPDAPAREWFSFRSWPDEYRSYFGLRFLPQIDTTNAAAREFLFTAAEYWLRRGVDGFRLDHAHGPTHAFWAEFRARTRAVRPDCVALGEVVETAALQRSYAGRMDGMLDFLFLQQIRAFFAFETETAAALETFTQRHLAYFPPGFTLATFIDNHDMNRFLWVARGDVDILKMAALYQFTLPRPPIVYYGTETGLKQWHDVEYDDGSRKSEESRVPMDWDGIDTSLLAFYRDLIRVRREHPGLWAGKRRIQPGTTDDFLVVAIFSEDASATLAINRGSRPERLRLPSGSNVLLHTMDNDPGAGWTETIPAKSAVLVLHPVARP
ncbi:MAG: alpha-amylase family glycosyl hydrolase [Thermomicrobiales bacterium]